MAIDKPLQTPLESGPTGPGVEVDVDMDTSPVEGDFEVTETEDGGAEVDFDPSAADPADPSGLPFDANLAEHMDDGDLTKLASKLINLYEKDEMARGEWKETYKDGLDMLGLKIEEKSQPWKGACGITHPLLAEAVVRFQSQQIGEMFPAAGPARTKILGKETPESIKQAGRIQKQMNYMMTEEMEEYREETDKLLFSLPLAGSSFKKTYYDPSLKRAVSEMVPAEDLCVGAGTKSLKTCRRLTHVNNTDPNDIRKLQNSGFYRTIDLSDHPAEIGEIAEKKEELVGVEGDYSDGDLLTLLEVHADIDLEGFEDYADLDSSLPAGTPTGIALPYVVTIDKSRRAVLGIRRNWLEDDTEKKRRNHFTHYQYIPGLGFYGLGLIHLIGGIARGSTSILRQLVDSGTLSNLQGGYKARGLRVKGDNTPLAPGEWRDVDVPGGKISDSLFPMPYGEPSNVLFQLLGTIVEEGRRFASLTDVNISSMNNEAPVGTTLALLERNLKVMTAISARIHASLRSELKILSSIVKDWYPEYLFETDDPEADLKADFDERIDVLPVSDPNSSTMAQRIMTYQTALQLAERAPQIYTGLDVLHRRMLAALEIQDIDEIIPSADDMQLSDPVSENMNIMNGIPVKAFMEQDHESHIQTHMLAAQDPKIVQMMEQNPAAGASHAAGMAHVTEHLAFKYRADIEANLGVQLPPPDEALPPDVEVQLSALVSQAAQQLFQRSSAEVAEQEAQSKLEDPIIQDQQANTEIKRLEAETKAKVASDRTQMDVAKLVQKHEIETDRMEQDLAIATERIRAELLGSMLEAASRTEQIESSENIKVAEFIMEQIRLEDDGVRDALQKKADKSGADMKHLVGILNENAARREKK
jgi:hypothetical protein